MILRICIGIPTYNNLGTIEAVVRDCLTMTEFPVIVIDDGSDVPVSLAFSTSENPLLLEALSLGRLQVLRFPKNRGKGIALQEAMKECIHQGFTHLLAMDGDGQHLVSEVPKMTELARAYPWDLILGNRKFISETVPGVSKFGRKFSNFWVDFQTHTKISDSQSGFRIYPLFHVQNLKFWTKRFDFEIEILIRLLWRGITIHEVEIEVFYPKPEDRVSHFHKFWDNFRISILNTALVVLSLLRSQHSGSQAARQAALAVGAGVWIGCTPFFGFHTLIAAACSFLFRLNFIYVLLGSQITVPPLAPFVVLASIALGKHFKLGFSLNWLAGSFVLGAVLACVFGVLTYALVRGFQSRTHAQASWNGKTRGGRIGNDFLKWILRHFGLKMGYFTLNFIVPYFYIFAPKARRASNEYWRILNPENSFLKRQIQVLGHLRRFAQVLLDRVFQAQHAEFQFETNPHGIENIIQSQGGVILLSAHVGGWDLATATLPEDGYQGAFHTVQYEAKGMTLKKIRGEKDPEFLKTLVVNEDSQNILRIRDLLDTGQKVGLMADRPIGNHFELVKLFGKLTPLDATPFRIAATCQARVIFTFGFKGKGNRYDFHATPSKIYPSESGPARFIYCQRWLQEFADALENQLRAYPDQWFNFYPFWSAAPKPPTSVGSKPGRNHLLEELHTPRQAKSEVELGSETNVEPVFQL